MFFWVKIFAADMRLKSNAQRFFEETQCLQESCVLFISFSLAVIFIMKLHKLVRFSTGCVFAATVHQFIQFPRFICSSCI